MSELKAIRSGEIYDIIEYEDCYRTDDLYYPKSEVDTVIAELEDEIKRKEGVEKRWFDRCMEARAENVKLKRALWISRAKAAEFWANYWFDVAPLEHIKYDRIGRMEGVEKEFTLTKVTKHMTASDWVGLWEKVEQLCRAKAEEYK